MKKLIFLILVFICFSVGIQSLPSPFENTPLKDSLRPVPKGVTANTVITNYLNFLGGKRKLASIDKLELISEAKLEGMTLQIARYKVSPNQYMKVIRSEDVVFERYIFDGKRGQVIDLRGNRLLTGQALEALKVEALIDIAAQCRKTKYKLLGIEILGGTKVYKMETLSPKQLTEYYEMNEGYKVRSIETLPDSIGVPRTIITDYKEYLPEKEIMFPHRIITNFGDKKIEMKVTTININSKARIKDEMFVLEN